MTKKKSIISKLFIALVALTLISCCFLGSTMARYTSTNSGKASTSVAEWNISATWSDENTQQSDDVVVDFGMLSPSSTADDTGSNDTGIILVATITNASDVKASVSLTSDEAVTFTYREPEPADKDANETNAKACFKIELFASTTKTDSVEISDTDDKYTAPVELNENDGVLYVYARVTWTTSSNTLDTWIGINVASLSWQITYTAVQASELPTA